MTDNRRIRRSVVVASGGLLLLGVVAAILPFLRPDGVKIIVPNKSFRVEWGGFTNGNVAYSWEFSPKGNGQIVKETRHYGPILIVREPNKRTVEPLGPLPVPAAQRRQPE